MDFLRKKQEKKKWKRVFFYVIINTLVSHLNKKKEVFLSFLNKNCGFQFDLKHLDILSVR